jgi:hypothetical protein
LVGGKNERLARRQYLDQGPKKPVGQRLHNTVGSRKTGSHGTEGYEQAGAQLLEMLSQTLLIELFLGFHGCIAEGIILKKLTSRFLPHCRAKVNR